MRRDQFRSIAHVRYFFNDESECGPRGKSRVLIEMLGQRKSVRACVKLDGEDICSAAQFILRICAVVFDKRKRCLFWFISSFFLVVECVKDCILSAVPHIILIGA
jgi:hypothetical protein